MDVSFQLMPYSETGTPPSSLMPVERKLKEGVIAKVGRQVFKDGQSQTKENDHGFDIWFASKVVSRIHAEMWAKDGQVYIRDIGSSSGTFLNKMRLSPTGKGSRPYPLKDGDVLQLGVDYKGKTEDIFKSINVKVIFSDYWVQLRKKQGSPVKFQTALRNLLTASNPYANTSAPDELILQPTECCICINAIGPYQALFMSPCSHCFHYKCVSVILSQSQMFPCPMCRQIANLTASVSMESLNHRDETDSIELGSDSDVSVTVDESGKAVISTTVSSQALEATTQTGRSIITSTISTAAPILAVNTRPVTKEQNDLSSKETSPTNSGDSKKGFTNKLTAFLHRKSPGSASSSHRRPNFVDSPDESSNESPGVVAAELESGSNQLPTSSNFIMKDNVQSADNDIGTSLTEQFVDKTLQPSEE